MPATKGGTGLSATGANGNFLRSNGTLWTSAPLADVDLPAGSGNYIQNTTTAQPGNFNIAGNGTAGGTLSGNVVSAATQFNIGSNRVFSTAGTDLVGTLNTNVFAGVGTGVSNTGFYNSVLGYEAEKKNTTGFGNSFFGWVAGGSNMNGHFNSFFGTYAGFSNISGIGNSSFGYQAGTNVTIGNYNTFIGARADAGALSSNLTNATAIGYGATVLQSDSLVLGNSVNVGIGTSAPTEKLTVETSTNSYGIVHTDRTITVGTFVGGAGNGGYLGTKSNHPFHLFANDGPASLTIDTSGFVRVSNLGSAGSTQLCRNGSNQIATCSSSRRYKTNIAPFILGLDLVKRLQPITFDWKSNGEHDMGFGAEDVAAVEPLLVTRNPSGTVEGVKYDRVAVVLVNAVLEQQTQIERQQDEIKRLANQVQNLKQLICLSKPAAVVCK